MASRCLVFYANDPEWALYRVLKTLRKFGYDVSEEEEKEEYRRMLSEYNRFLFFLFLFTLLFGWFIFILLSLLVLGFLGEPIREDIHVYMNS